MLYSSTDLPTDNQVIDANSYPPFKLVDSTIITRIMKELDNIEGQEDGIQIHLHHSCSPLSKSQHHVHWLAPLQRHYAVRTLEQ